MYCFREHSKEMRFVFVFVFVYVSVRARVCFRGLFMIGYVCMFCTQMGFSYLQSVIDGAKRQAASTPHMWEK